MVTSTRVPSPNSPILPIGIPSLRRRVIHPSSDKVITEQHHKDEVDIKVILKRHGLLKIHPNDLRPDPTIWQHGNGILPSFQEMNNVVVSMKQAFYKIPASIREKFRNDPTAFVEFVSNPDNRADIEKLGISTAHLPPVKVDEPPVQPPATGTPAGGGQA